MDIWITLITTIIGFVGGIFIIPFSNWLAWKGDK